MKLVTLTPCGFMPLITCLIVLSFPAASIACSTITMPSRPSAYSASCSSAQRAMFFSISRAAVCLSSPASLAAFASVGASRITKCSSAR